MARAKPKRGSKKAGKPFTLSFFFGLVAGAFVALVLAIALAYIGWLKPLVASSTKDMAKYFSPPDFPQTMVDSKAADYSLKFTDLDGKEHSLDEMKGKVCFLNFWATWCGPCVAEMSGMAALVEKAKDPRLVFLFISSEKPDQVKKFLAEKGLKLPVFLYSGQAPPPAYCTRGIPATFILSADGKIVFQEVGARKWEDPSALAFLKKLLKKAGGQP